MAPVIANQGVRAGGESWGPGHRVQVHGGQAGRVCLSERRACRLMTMTTSSYRYDTRRSDHPLSRHSDLELVKGQGFGRNDSFQTASAEGSGELTPCGE